MTKALRPDQKPQLFWDEYVEACKSHAAITDFRAKLLALLPISSATGIGLLVLQVGGDVEKVDSYLLLGLGLFGAVVTIGLFFYELRQIDICKQLRNHAAWIEKELGIAAGQFSGRRERLSIREAFLPGPHRARDDRLKALELAGQAAAKTEGTGFLGRPLIGAEAAGYVIYPTVIVAWMVVAIVGFLELVC